MNPIVGIGELLWDVYPDGRKVAGGAPFNFAYHCHQLGHPAVIVSRVGDDALGRELREEVRRLGLSDEYIQTDKDHPTGTVQVTLDEHKVPAYTITENVAWDHIAWTESLRKLTEDARATCSGTLAHRSEVSSETIMEFRSSRHSTRVFDVNLRQGYFNQSVLEWGFAQSYVVKLSEDELHVISPLFGLTSDGTDPLSTFHTALLHPWQVCLVTRGAAGLDVNWPEHGKRFYEPAAPARVVDTVGAGDAFTAAMVCLHLEGRPLRDCARFANHYAARVCEHQGATPRIDRAEVERAAFGA